MRGCKAGELKDERLADHPANSLLLVLRYEVEPLRRECGAGSLRRCAQYPQVRSSYVCIDFRETVLSV